MVIKEKLELIFKRTKNGFKYDDSEVVDLKEKVDMFIYWYYRNMVSGKYTMIGMYSKPIEMRNFIEKMAVWYELRYPSYEINRLMPGSDQENSKIDDIMFKYNLYLNENLGIDNDAKDLKWSKFYDFNTFFKSLPCEEAHLLAEPTYPSHVYLGESCYLYLDSYGHVQRAEGLSEYTGSIVGEDDVEGLHVKDVAKLLKMTNLNNNNIVNTIDYVDKRKYQLEKMLDAVMYRIIERGGTRIGPRRGLIFAKEFGRNIDIPMMCGIDTSDPGLENFINEYINAGGNENLVCYENYFNRIYKSGLNTISISDIVHPKKENDEKTLIKK